jgi:hypothetical protein
MGKVASSNIKITIMSIPMNKRLNITVVIFIAGVVLFYVTGQLIFLREPVSHDFPLRQVRKTHMKSTVVGISVADSETLLVRTNASINALDTESGKVIWQKSLSQQPDPRPAVAHDNRVYVTDGDSLLALDQEDGSVLWRQNIPYSDSWVTDVSESGVVVNQPGFDILVFDSISGEFLWRKPVCRGAVKAFFSGSNVIVPCNGIVGLDAASGEVVWEGLDAGIIGQTDFADGTLYYYIDFAYAFDSHSQEDLWKTAVAHNGIENFKVLEDKLFYRDTNQLCMLERKSGLLEWCEKFPLPQAPAILRDTVYAFNGNHKRIRAIKVDDGNLIGALDLSNLNYFSIDREILASNEALLFFSNGKDVYAFGY